ncbi:hypothetical protein Pelo_3191 [Pelomyxa schiedti]|nr:hypothetical protein Pelo_3191 [Pelomyxa schiedti]
MATTLPHSHNQFLALACGAYFGTPFDCCVLQLPDGAVVQRDTPVVIGNTIGQPYSTCCTLSREDPNVLMVCPNAGSNSLLHVDLEETLSKKALVILAEVPLPSKKHVNFITSSDPVCVMQDDRIFNTRTGETYEFHHAGDYLGNDLIGVQRNSSEVAVYRTRDTCTPCMVHPATRDLSRINMKRVSPQSTGVVVWEVIPEERSDCKSIVVADASTGSVIATLLVSQVFLATN